MEITISKELRDLVHPLTQEEFSLLQESLKQQGCLTPLIVYQDRDELILLDGHHRYTYCQAQGIPYGVKLVEIESRDAAKLWILGHQLGRRNLSESQRSMLAAKRASLLGLESHQTKMELARASKRDEIIGGNIASSVSSPRVRIRSQVAKEAGVSEGQVKRALEVLRKAPALAEKVQAGTMSLKEAHSQITSPLPTEVSQLQQLRADLQTERTTVSDLKRLVKMVLGDDDNLQHLPEETSRLYERLMQ